MKPDWKYAPEWANWLAMDSDGAWFWYEMQPDARRGKFRTDGKVTLAVTPKDRWENTLEPRP